MPGRLQKEVEIMPGKKKTTKKKTDKKKGKKKPKNVCEFC